MEQRAKALADARALLNKAEAEGRDLTAEERSQYDGFDQEYDQLTASIEREERLAQREEEQRKSANGDRNPQRDRQPGGAEQRDTPPNDTAEYRQSMLRYLITGANDGQAIVDRRGDGEARAILGVSLTGTGATGGVLAPSVLERTLLDFSEHYYLMRRISSVRNSGSDIEIPYSTAGTVAYHLDEGADFTKSTPAWSKLAMGAYKVGALSVVTHEAMEDMFINLENWIRDDFGTAFAELEEDDFVNGDGVKKPRGFMLDAETGVTTAAAAAITADELIDMQHALKRKFRNNAIWVMNDATVKAIRKLKDSSGQYLWQPSIQAGKPNTLLGRTLEVSDRMPTVAAGAKAIAYGDFNWYRILDRRGLYFQRLNELYATSGQVGFLAYKRYDAKLLDNSAIQILKMKAT